MVRYFLQLAAPIAAALLLGGCVGPEDECWDCDPPGPVLKTRYFVYVANNVDGPGSVSGYKIDGTSGTLTPIDGSPFPAGANPDALLAIGGLLYVANSTASSITGYSIDHTTGALTALSGSPVSTGAGTFPRSFALRNPYLLYVVSSSTDNLVTFNLIGPPYGALTRLGASALTGSAPVAMIVHASGKFAYVANSASNNVSAYGLPSASAFPVPLGDPVLAGTGPSSIATDFSGKFVYVANFGSNDISAYVVDPIGGGLLSVGSVSTGLGPVFVAVHPFGQFLYVANLNSDSISVYSIDRTSGALTSVGTPAAAGRLPRGITIEVSGRFLYAANAGSGDVSAYSIDLRTGALTSLGARVPAGPNPFAISSTYLMGL